ncbi:MAG: sigma-70 family RNA polymerase sigma factor [Balneola sp.]|nr:sigma-70 family RNA polymerase sigma factor [Balneola sp.]MBO6649489.1 sigma-70 family RNA polymerase sigma factor [Balneola sp.]MBO6711305.1 sigma-70 family RNA polymerase sigma factor [Balneola sp.]MBO6800580.1 sigma-70 family RNA polymerase sigma factor [Balneola sp.]MBO6869241.1 sigma-70 family RNA polymerase sigma factor [Balneola sp.]
MGKKKDWNPKGGIKSYLYRATRNQSLNYLKHQKIVQEWEDEKKATKPTYTDNVSKEINSSEQLRRRIEEAIHQLPQKRRTIYEFSRNHGLTYQEIAEVLNISIKTVETQMRRALKYLRSHLKRNFE